MHRLRNMKTQKHAQTEKHDNKVVGRQVGKQARNANRET